MVCSTRLIVSMETGMYCVLILNHRYAKTMIGDPPQEIEVDLNMLASDFYIFLTTSRKGSKYDDYFSQTRGRTSHSKSGDSS